MDHPTRGRNCPLEISNSAPVEDTGRGKERDEWLLRKKRSERREGGRVTKMTGWATRKRRPDAALAKHYIGRGIGFALVCISMRFLRSLWEDAKSHWMHLRFVTEVTD